jgi:aminoglycoside phosphotransferase (APT) family kinase protein
MRQYPHDIPGRRREHATVSMHDDQLDVDTDVIRRLIADQFPRWSTLPVRAVSTTGTVNAIFRIGNSLAARLPLRPGDPTCVRDWLEREAAAAREFAAVSPVPAPAPVALGEPGHGYPLPWSVQTWVPGRDAIANDPAGSRTFAEELIGLLCCLRAADTHGRRFSGDNRGGHLADHDDWMELCFQKSAGLVDVARLRALWRQLRTLPEIDMDVMCHGDLTPTNILVDAGHLIGVLDTGGYAAADPALDLVCVWHLLDGELREMVRRRLGCSDVQWCRGMAWALEQAMGLVWYYASSNPVMSRWGRRTLDRLLLESTE